MGAHTRHVEQYKNRCLLSNNLYEYDFSILGVILNGLIVTALSLFLTPPDSVAVVFSSDERSFSKLKLIKTYMYLLSCMTQERLSDLWLLNIERERFKDTDRDAVGRKCANAKAKKVCVLAWLT